MLSIIEKILEVVGKLVGIKTDLEKADKDLRVKISDLFDQIADCLLRVANELSQRQVPHGACAEIKTYSVGIAVLISPVIGQTSAMEIADKLRDAHNVEELAAALQNAEDAEREINKIREASGEMKAMANLLRVNS